MCGIAGYLGRREPDRERISAALTRMRQRGPDAQGYRTAVTQQGNFAWLLHSRLSILDLDERSNQPFEEHGCTLVFNGEIYNYEELRTDLEDRGHKFRTDSDTEVLLHSYLEFGEDCVQAFEGMWAFAIWDARRNHLFLSRDRFGEKPLYLAQRPEGFYFASETAILKKLAGWSPSVNSRQVARYLSQGYKSLYKREECFYKDITSLRAGHSLILKEGSPPFFRKYWDPNLSVNSGLSLNDAIAGTREKLLDSIRIRLRADVPLAFCLSGGVDSSALVSVAAKVFNQKVSTFSIIDSDERYHERDNIETTVADTGVDAHFLDIPREDALPRLKKLVGYHDAPLATISYYVHSLLSEQISANGFRVVFSGTSADELFTGYYDHFLLHLNELLGTPHYGDALHSWETHICGFVRNPFLKNPRLYAEFPNFREHVYDNSKEFATFLLGEVPEEYTEENYHPSLLRSRMLNEIFHEATPVILHEDDLNSMCYSIENRSPYLDSRLFEFAYSIPPQHLIRNGYTKYVLREALTGILNDKVRLDRRKKGFNASIHSAVNLGDAEFKEWLLAPHSPLANYLNLSKVEPLLEEPHLANHYSKFLFSVINARIFLEGSE